MFRRIVFSLVLTLALPARADFITDKLLVGLYETLGDFSKPIKILSSGTAFEVLERQNGYAKVKLNDGSVGWVELRYVTNETPTLARFSELEKQNKQLQATVEKGKTEFNDLKKKTEGFDKLKVQAKELEERVGKADKRVTELEEQLKQKDEQVKTLRQENYTDKGGTELQGKIQELEAKLLQSQVKLARRAGMKEEAVFVENDALRERMQKATLLLKIDDNPLPPPPPPPPPPKEEEPPGLPIWVYFVVLLTLITGVVAGFALFDFRSRRRFGF